MTTSQQTPFLSEVLSGDPIPIGKLAYFRERLRNRLYELVVSEFLERRDRDGLTRADLARRIRRRPEQVTRWLGAPGNWTLDTVSDLMLAMAIEPKLSASSLEDHRESHFPDRPVVLTPLDRAKRGQESALRPFQHTVDRWPLQKSSAQTETTNSLADQLMRAA